MTNNVPVFDKPEPFVEKVRENIKNHQKFVGGLSEALQAKTSKTFKVIVGSSKDASSGRRVTYHIHAEASYETHPLVKYQDIRYHDSEVGGEPLDIPQETNEFRDSVTQLFEKEGVHTSVSGLEITLS
jgi:hypothetical protein